MLTSPWKRHRDRAKEREVKRDAVLLVAVRAFNEKGFHNTSLDEVAERLNVTKPTLYHYFENKDAILAECVRIGIAMVEDASASTKGKDITGMERLLSVMRKYAEIVTMDFGKCIILVGEADVSAEHRRELRALKKRIDQTFRQCVEQGVKDGSIAPCNPKFTAFTAAGALSWIARWYDEKGPLTPPEVAEQCISALVNGLAPRAGTRAVAAKNGKRKVASKAVRRTN